MRFSFRSLFAAVLGVVTLGAANTSFAYVSYTHNGQRYSAPVVQDVAFTPGLDDVTFLVSHPVPQNFYVVFELNKETHRDSYISEGLLTSTGEQYPVYRNLRSLLTKGYGRYQIKAAVCAKRSNVVHDATAGISVENCSKPYYETFDYYKTSNHVSAYDERGFGNTVVNVYNANPRHSNTGNTSTVVNVGCRYPGVVRNYNCPPHNGTRVGQIARTSLQRNDRGFYKTYGTRHQLSNGLFKTHNGRYYTVPAYQVPSNKSYSQQRSTKYVPARPFKTPVGTYTHGYYSHEPLPLYARVKDRDAHYESMFAKKYDVGTSSHPYEYIRTVPAHNPTQVKYTGNPQVSGYVQDYNGVITPYNSGFGWSKYSYGGPNWVGNTGIPY